MKHLMSLFSSVLYFLCSSWTCFSFKTTILLFYYNVGEFANIHYFFSLPIIISNVFVIFSLQPITSVSPPLNRCAVTYILKIEFKKIAKIQTFPNEKKLKRKHWKQKTHKWQQKTIYRIWNDLIAFSLIYLKINDLEFSISIRLVW